MVPGNFGSGAAVFAATTTSHPSAARRSASALPTPRDAPVTIATRPAKRITAAYFSSPTPKIGGGLRKPHSLTSRSSATHGIPAAKHRPRRSARLAQPLLREARMRRFVAAGLHRFLFGATLLAAGAAGALAATPATMRIALQAAAGRHPGLCRVQHQRTGRVRAHGHDRRQPQRDGSATIGGLPAGAGFTIALTSTAADGGTQCGGSAPFSVTAHATTRGHRPPALSRGRRRRAACS